MAKSKTFFVSELTGDVIYDEASVVRVTVHEHPGIEAPVEINAAASELKALDGKALNAVRLTLKPVNGKDETITVPLEVFDKLATDEPMSKVLADATPAVGLGRPAASAAPKVDFGSIEHAGRPHRGRTTEAEKETVRKNLKAINERLKKEGHRQIDPTNTEHSERYGLQDMEQ